MGISSIAEYFLSVLMDSSAYALQSTHKREYSQKYIQCTTNRCILYEVHLGFNGHYPQKDCVEEMYRAHNIHFIKEYTYCLGLLNLLNI